ncbi:MAG: FtsX-like permease family protein [Aestuariivita sp.]|nr:FtsX-like permease family protein [Aestuariivita sp.]MCY4201349.1 FtsX-like permease family protein [Aestuariivita sp.]
MNIGLAAKLAVRDLRGGVRSLQILMACLTLGVAAISAIGTVRESLQAGLTQEATALLGGDAQIEFAYRFANSRELAWMSDNAALISEVTDFRSMLTVKRGNAKARGLTQVKSIDDAYPLIGEVEISPPLTLSKALDGRNGIPGAVVHPTLVERLGLGIGDLFYLGEQKFVLTAILDREPDSLSGGFELGPRTIVRTAALSDSGLLQSGSLFSTKYRLKLFEGAPLEETARRAEEQLANSGMQWRDSRNATPRVSEFIERLSTFLTLLGLSGLAIGGVGVFVSVQDYLEGKLQVIAILKTLGADQSLVLKIFLGQVGLVALLAVLVGAAIGGLTSYSIGTAFGRELPVPSVFSIYPAPMIEAAILGMITAAIFSVWPLARIDEVRAAALFRDTQPQTRRLPSWIVLAFVSLFLITLVLLAGWFNASTQLTFWMTLGLIATMMLLALAAAVMRKLCGLLVPVVGKKPELRWALCALSGSQMGSLPMILALGLGFSVLSVLLQFDGNLRNRIINELPEAAPAYFFVDIQREQLSGFRQRLDDDPAVTRVESVPMLRGIISKINGKPANETAGDHWVLEGDRGITYAENLSVDTNLVAGEWWDANYIGEPQVSFAAQEALEMGISLGDQLTLNILGRDIQARVSSLREVDFSKAGIGFIMVLNPAALAGAPHSFIATVYTEESAEAAIVRDLSERFPNITAIRVRDVIERVNTLLSAISAATLLGALAAIAVGFLVLIGVAATGKRPKSYEAAVLRTLGASRRQILLSFSMRTFILGLAAGTIAFIMGIIGGWLICTYLIDTSFEIIWSAATMVIGGGLLVSIAAEIVFVRQPVITKPAQVLRLSQ